MTVSRRAGLAAIAFAHALAMGCLGCSSSGSPPGANTPEAGLPEASASDAGADVGHDAKGPADASRPSAETGAPDAAADVTYDVAMGACPVTFTYTPTPGTSVSSVAVTGEWSSFATPGNAMSGPDANGTYTATIPLSPGLVAYKLLVSTGGQPAQYTLDPGARWQKYVGGVENSAVNVLDCHLPTLTVVDNAVVRPAAGQGQFQAHVLFAPGAGAPGVDPSSLSATVRSNQVTSPLSSIALDATGTKISLLASNLVDGKYTVFVNAKDRAGQPAAPLRLVFWVEAEAFEWEDALLYMAVTDRFKDGDVTNDPPATAGVDPREDFQGGDYQGVTAKIEDGTFDQLGVRVLWLTPYNTNPPDTGLASDGVHQTMGYHGYWPIRAREVDPRWGGDQALKDMIVAAHAHSIRVIQDVVAHHIHQEHEYNTTHPDWFKQGCVCGTDNCDWTVHRLDCVFATYMPNVDWTNPDAAAQYEADSIWWIDQFDLDGFRIDAVKQVPDIAIVNLTAAVRGEFEKSGLRFFMTGETAMGWSNCDLACNASQYQTINEYIGPNGLDGQFDFPLYYAVPMQDFVSQNFGMTHVDYWTQASGWEYPQGSIMSPYIGSQDTARFISIADYNGNPRSDGSSPYNQWTNIAEAPTTSTPYAQLRSAYTWELGLPGAPLIYYGDEYGQFGGVDPNNRLTWRGDGVLSNDEQATLAYVRKLGQARKSLVALRRGEYRPVYSTETTLVYGRQTTAGDVALVAFSTSASPASFTATLPVTMPLSDGTTLHDRLGGPDVVVTGGAVTLSLGARGAAVLAP